jgi:hypothetical protein
MRFHLWLAGLVLAAALAACTLDTPLPPALPPAPPVETQTPPAGTATLFAPPLDPPTYTPTSTPSTASVRPKDALVNCRVGPGTAYVLIGELKEGQSTKIAGRNSQGTWYYIHDPGNPGGFCWVSADFVVVTGSAEGLPIVNPPAPSVVDLALTVDPTIMTVACDQFPQAVYMTAVITTDGPALVTYRWEASTGVSSADNSIIFDEAGTKTISDYYRIGGPNDYWIAIHAVSPNEMRQQANFRVICTP